jgi:hypothetical protein
LIKSKEREKLTTAPDFCLHFVWSGQRTISIYDQVAWVLKKTSGADEQSFWASPAKRKPRQKQGVGASVPSCSNGCLVNAPPARAGLTTMNTAWIMKFVY